MRPVIDSWRLPPDKSSATVFGAGGTIGSYLVSHLGRMPGLDAVMLVDSDTYEEKNLRSQDIAWRDVGRFKASVQARRLRNINRDLIVIPIADALENIPLGLLRATVLLSCLDSRVARQHVNEIAFRLRQPLIDAGVLPSAMLARVSVYRPALNLPCLECLWDEQDYALLEELHPCGGNGHSAAPTNAPSTLGALAATLQAIECEKLLAGGAHAGGCEHVFNAAAHTQFVTTLVRNPRCRFDHHSWAIEKVIPNSLTLRDAGSLTPVDAVGPRHLRVAGRWFAPTAACPACQSTEPLWIGPRGGRCVRCRSELRAPRHGLREFLELDALAQELQGRSLRTIGVRSGDVVSVSAGDRVRHFEVSNS